MRKPTADSFADFLERLKRAGVHIYREGELRERLAEAQRWRYAFCTLAANGESIGIRFDARDGRCNEDAIRRTFTEFRFPEGSPGEFVARLRLSH
jgi:hypothetical protein